MASFKIILGLCLVAAIIHAGEADVKCYKCEGEPDSDCAKAVVSAMEVVDCPGSVAMCSATDVRNGHIRRFSRGCTKWSNPDLCTLLYRLSANNPTAMKVFSCKTCWGDLCNTQVTKR